MLSAQVHIEFTDGEDKITIEGPPEQVEEARVKLEAITADLVSGERTSRRRSRWRRRGLNWRRSPPTWCVESELVAAGAGGGGEG